ncbi:amidohydrolase family protein [Pseudomonas sp. NPDC007930]|uniref:amidohydrolase family protein n=1 Tax=Pseudomonas sp. NPDC007930 TaxID=3364417 RepID=UPI0036EA748B
MQLPPNACDAHLHIMDPRFGGEAAFSAATYQALAQPLGLARAVIVQPKNYGTDNRCTLDAIAQFKGQARGIAVLTPEVSDAELQQLHAGGIRGVRFSLWNPGNAVVSLGMLEPLAARIAELGWHVQLHLGPEQALDAQALIARLPLPVVFDHLGRLPPAQGTRHPLFRFIAERIDAGQAWVKLSGAYLNTAVGAPAYPDASAVAQAFAELAPERVVWGSDWPHVTEHGHADTAGLLALLGDWVGAGGLRRVLVDNPARLYGWA